MTGITYILGAGASCQAMPLVSNFSQRFENFKNYVSNQNVEDLYKDVSMFNRSIKIHATFDTFFKKLYHQEYNVEMINRYKKVLLLYFLFEHLKIKELPSTVFDDYNDAPNQEKEFRLDPRYEALIAGLLKPMRGTTEFYTNIDFLTWNYDVNLLYALKNFIAPKESFRNFFESRKKEGFFKISEQIKLFHLNGVAYHPILENIYEENMNEKYNFLLKEYQEDSQFNYYAENISFAWEKNISDENLKRPVLNSKNIILIGYSLPLYNRSIDLKILNKDHLKNKNLYIQDLNSSDITSLLKSDFKIIESNFNPGTKILSSNNCNSFVVPSSIF